MAGMETTSNTLYWSLLYVALNPEVKRKVYEELDAVIGSDRLITMSDKTELNYVNATINVSWLYCKGYQFRFAGSSTSRQPDPSQWPPCHRRHSNHWRLYSSQGYCNNSNDLFSDVR